MTERKGIAEMLERAMQDGKLPPMINALLATVGGEVRETAFGMLRRAQALQPWGADEREFWAREAHQAVGRFVLGSAGREELNALLAGVVLHFVAHPEMLDQ